MSMTNHEFHMMQLADSLFPSGTFGLSGGLESFVKSGRIKDVKGVLAFIRLQIKFQVLPCDCTILQTCFTAASQGNLSGIVEADSRYFSLKLVSEVRMASTRSGTQLLRTLVGITKNSFARKFQSKVVKGKSPGTYPACLAVAAFAFHVPKESAVRMLLYSYCASIVGSAIRMGIISHFEGQEILANLASDVNSSEPSQYLHEIWQLNPLSEILQMRHEQDEFRMFIT
jgi:urease accessory protein